MYWFIMTLTKPPFGSCAIYFHYGVTLNAENSLSLSLCRTYTNSIISITSYVIERDSQISCSNTPRKMDWNKDTSFRTLWYSYHAFEYTSLQTFHFLKKTPKHTQLLSTSIKIPALKPPLKNLKKQNTCFNVTSAKNPATTFLPKEILWEPRYCPPARTDNNCSARSERGAMAMELYNAVSLCKHTAWLERVG